MRAVPSKTLLSVVPVGWGVIARPRPGVGMRLHFPDTHAYSQVAALAVTGPGSGQSTASGRDLRRPAGQSLLPW